MYLFPNVNVVLAIAKLISVFTSLLNLTVYTTSIQLPDEPKVTLTLVFLMILYVFGWIYGYDKN